MALFSGVGNDMPTAYVVTIFDPDTGKTYKHTHAILAEAEVECGEAQRWGWLASMVVVLKAEKPSAETTS
jgi:hypothetical protein